MGYLKKFKMTKKRPLFVLLDSSGKRTEKKFFVLRESSSDKPAILEYHESETKFRNNCPPKRSFAITACFAVNSKEDCKEKHAISVFTLGETLSVVCNSEREQSEWLQDLLELQKSGLGEEPLPENSPPLTPLYDYVWNVDIQRQGLGQTKNILGPYRLCLVDRTLKLVPLNHAMGENTLVFPLVKLRKVGHVSDKSFFYIELGRQACTGPGDFCMAAEDKVSAQHIHEIISEAMRKGGPPEENAHVSTSGHRPRSNTQDSSRPKLTPDNRQSFRSSGQNLSGSREKTGSAEQKLPEYFVPDFARSTSTNEENYLAIDRDASYLPCDFPPKIPSSPEVPMLNYSSISRPRENFSYPQGLSPTGEQRPPLSLSIPEEPGDYMTITMPNASSQVVPVSGAAEQPGSAASSGESGYFEMNLPPKFPDVPHKTPPTVVSPPPPEKTDEAGGYMIMAPGSATSSGICDSRRSTMSNASYQSHPSDREENIDRLGEVTYAVMEGPRSRNRDSGWDNSSSSLSSSFGWERINSLSSRADFKLEKVKAFINEDGEDAQLREARAYSTGCQLPKASITSFKPESPSGMNPEAFRIRAFSLGNHSSPSSARSGRKGVVHSPSAVTVMNSGSITASPPMSLNIRTEAPSTSKALQISPESESSTHSGKPVDGKKSNESHDRDDDLMELTFRQRSGT
ncbi:insulin receptor substrate 1-like isoform X2 [Paramacrobiotus metropolitanus]|uniref:insulin receptor substrate 1-like isoform X2 n=1 Tax=Paramacrobiotus metropolitanus TaxID=2943436 RepID=UPI00244657DD|nr:insulin receptor substrate 1-like isoform X2 [Paramacrobiotus metropolitanus]